MKNAVSRILAWAGRNERHLGAIAFVFGFVTDLFTFTLLSVAFANIAFASYLGLAAITIAISHVLPRPTVYQKNIPKALSVIAPLAAQYAIGSLLSGFMIFYTKSADISASWPFLVLLALVFIGNEFFRTYYKYAAFQLALLFFALYAYLIFAIPLLVDRLGKVVFFGSTAAAISIFAVYLFALSRVRRKELTSALTFALPSVVVIVLIIQGAYFTGALPPIPLTMPESGIVHSLAHRDGAYVTMSEAVPMWYEVWKPRVVHQRQGVPLIAFASTAAPIKFSARVVHRWEWRDETTHAWVTKSFVSFPISGGRAGGYRGFSEYTPNTAGTWRVSVETPDGQVIGRIPFVLVFTDTLPLLHEETH